MTKTAPVTHSLVVYRGHPARVLKVEDKLEIELEGGRTQRVRPKDVTLLHPGPLRSLGDLGPRAGEVTEAWEVLAGGRTDVSELAELVFGEHTPQTAWAAWALVADGLYFHGTPGEVQVRTPEDLHRELAIRQAKAEKDQAWSRFLARVEAGTYDPADARFLREVEGLATGSIGGCRVLRELGRQETAETAHAFLLRLGYWSQRTNPYPRRFGMASDVPDLEVPALEPADRLDLTHLDAYAIDDEGNQDPDDALSLDGERLWVHVADVAALVGPDGVVDLEARARGANLYLPEGLVPMLPPRVTTELGLGLKPVSAALSFGFRVTPDARVIDVEVRPSWVRVSRLSYEQVEQCLGEAPFAQLWEIAQRYRERRRAQGAAFIALPEAQVRVVGAEVTIRALPRLRSRELVMEAMLMAGEAAASFALERDLPFPYSTQPPPEERQEPASLAAMYAYRRRLRRSQMKSVPEPHAGLGLESYAQVTSPLRRYLDLVAHQQIRAYLAGRPLLGAQEVLARVGAAEAVIGNVRKAERSSVRHWTLVYLMQRPDWTGEGVLVDRAEHRGVVLIPHLALETRVRVPPDVPLDGRVELALTGVDLPELAAFFRVEGVIR